MQFRDKTAYVWGLRYRWDLSLSRNLITRFPHFWSPWLYVCISKRYILIYFLYISFREDFYPDYMTIYFLPRLYAHLLREDYDPPRLSGLPPFEQCERVSGQNKHVVIHHPPPHHLAILTVLITLNLLSSTPHPHPYAKYERVSVWDKHVVACHWPKEIMSWCPAT